MSKAIKDCPFCGSEADVQNDFGVDFWVQCKNLHCGKVDGTIYHSPAPAINSWNCRPESLAAPSVASAAKGDELPKIPKSRITTDMHQDGEGHDAYTIDDLRNYGEACARAAVLAERAAIAQHIGNDKTFKEMAPGIQQAVVGMIRARN